MEAEAMVELIEGAAYVTPSQGKLYTYDQLEICRQTIHPIPDDLVMIWRPGDEVQPIINGFSGEVGGVHITRRSDV
jgi:hypothetical protein